MSAYSIESSNEKIEKRSRSTKALALSVADAFPHSSWAKDERLKGYRAVVPIMLDLESQIYIDTRRGNLKRILEDAGMEREVYWHSTEISPYVTLHWQEKTYKELRQGGKTTKRLERVAPAEKINVRIDDIARAGKSYAIAVAKAHRQSRLDALDGETRQLKELGLIGCYAPDDNDSDFIPMDEERLWQGE